MMAIGWKNILLQNHQFVGDMNLVQFSMIQYDSLFFFNWGYNFQGCLLTLPNANLISAKMYLIGAHMPLIPANLDSSSMSQ